MPTLVLIQSADEIVTTKISTRPCKNLHFPVFWLRAPGKHPRKGPRNDAHKPHFGGCIGPQVVEGLHAKEPVDCVVLSMAHVSIVDVSGLEVLQEQHKRLVRTRALFLWLAMFFG